MGISGDIRFDVGLLNDPLVVVQNLARSVHAGQHISPHDAGSVCCSIADARFGFVETFSWIALGVGLHTFVRGLVWIRHQDKFELFTAVEMQYLPFNTAFFVDHGIDFSPLSMWDGSKHLEKLVFLRSADEVVAVLSKSMPKDSVLMTTSYSPAAVMAYHHGQYVPVFGEGRHYARQDDLIVDFSQLDERNFRIFTRSPIDKQDFQLYFDEVEVHSFKVNGAEFYWLDGTGFKYAIYREMVLAEIAKKYHDLPKWLPVLGNPFCERYGFGDCSPGRT